MDRKSKTLLSKLPPALLEIGMDSLYERAEVDVVGGATIMYYVSGRVNQGIRVSRKVITPISKLRSPPVYLSNAFDLEDKEILRYRPLKVKP